MSIVNNFFSKKVWFGVLMVISTSLLSASAAYYSVFGLSSMFAGAKTEVIIMASALEFSKLIVASYLHNNWNMIGRLLKVYLTAVVLILMLITSAGIYGFLTAAYQTTADQLTVLDKQTEVVNLKKNRFAEQISEFKLEKEQIVQSISDLSKGLTTNIIQYNDADGNIITTTSSATRKSLELQLNNSKIHRDNLSLKIESLTDSITKLDLVILDMESNNEVAAEIGPLRYLAKITGKSMDVIVNWFTLLIVFVFDPLAIAMVIAINKYISGNPIKVDTTVAEYSRNDVRVIRDNIETSLVPNEQLKMATDTYNNTITQNSEIPVNVEPKKEVDSETIYGEVLPKRKYNDSVKSSEGILK
jgi:hypothetical protein